MCARCVARVACSLFCDRACTHCAMSGMTMKAGVEEAIRRVAPEVVAVEAVPQPVEA